MLRIFKQYYPIRNIFFVMGEFLVIFASVFFAYWIFCPNDLDINNGLIFLKILLIAFICQTCLYYNDLYDLKITDSFIELGIRLLQALGATAILLAGIYSILPETSIGLKVFTISIVFDIIFIVSWRIGYTFILNRRIFDEKIFIIGSGELARNILYEVNDRKGCGHVVTGVILEGLDDEDEQMRKIIKNYNDVKIFQNNHCDNEWCGDLSKMTRSLEVNKIVVSIKDLRNYFPTNQLLKCRVDGVEILEGSSFYEMLTGKLLVDQIKPGWLIFSDGFKKSRTKYFIKRMIDMTLSFIMLIMLLPLILLTAVLIKLDTKEPQSTCADKWRYFAKLCSNENIDISIILRKLIIDYLDLQESGYSMVNIWQSFHESCAKNNIKSSSQLIEIIQNYISKKEPENLKHPVFFSQERMGKKGKIYNIYKFRSMIVNAEKLSGPVWAGQDDKRITRIGNFIRKWRIDELPQLWNVLKGEMSFVGPRPEREHFVKQLEKTIPFYRERLSVKPGLTGWAQVSYGYGASEDDAKEKLNYDLFYIKNMSIPMDLMIVLRTIKIVLFGKGR